MIKNNSFITKILTTILLESSILVPMSLLFGLTSTTGLIAACTLSIPVLPACYSLAKKIEDKYLFKVKKEISKENQKLVAILEMGESDRRITSLTANFSPEINDKLNEYKLILDEDEKNNINQFIYMINANYYDEINKCISSLIRENFVDILLFQVASHLKNKNIKTFGAEDTRELLDNCYFIPDDLKEDMIREFYDSRTKVSKDKYEYRIIRKDFDEVGFEYVEAKQDQVYNKSYNFNIENINDYFLIYHGLIAQDEYFSQFGDLNNLDINLEEVKEIMIIISNKFKRELIENDPEYRNVDLVGSYMSNLIVYSLVNNKTSIGIKEMLNTFKEWDYIPFNLKLDMIDEIYSKKDIDYSINPYRSKEKFVKNKVLEFPGVNK